MGDHRVPEKYRHYLSLACFSEVTGDGRQPLTKRCKLEADFFMKPEVQAGIDKAHGWIEGKCGDQPDCLHAGIDKLYSIIHNARAQHAIETVRRTFEHESALNQAKLFARDLKRQYLEALFSPACLDADAKDDERCDREAKLLTPLFEAALDACLDNMVHPDDEEARSCLVEAMSLTYHISYPPKAPKGSVGDRLQTVWRGSDKAGNLIRKMQVHTNVLKYGGR